MDKDVQAALNACLLAIALTACGAGPSTGTVTGHVQLRVCGGAYRPDQTSCPSHPMADATLAFQLVGASNSSTAITDSAGAYRIDLKPGTYSARVMEMRFATTQQPGAFADNPAVDGSRGPNTVTVVAGKTATEDFSFTIQMQ